MMRYENKYMLKIGKETIVTHFLKNDKPLKPHKIQNKKYISLSTNQMDHHLNFPLAVSQNCRYPFLISPSTKKYDRDETKVERESEQTRI